MLIVVGANLAVAVTVGIALRAEGETVSGGTGGGVGDGDEGDDCANDDGGFSGATSADQRVALVVVRFHANGGEGQVGAVDGHDGRLGEAGAGIDILDGGVDRDDRRDQKEEEVDLGLSVVWAKFGVRVRTVMAAWFMPHPLFAK